jgi:glycosyltransferase involved in cell wall biosynthesis
MHKFRLLISTYHGAFISPGGGEVELFEIFNSLKKNEFHVDLYGPESQEIKAYDKVLHFGVNQDGFEFLKQVKASKKEILLWPNLWWNGSQDSKSIEVAKNIFDLADKVIFKSKAEFENNIQFFSIDSKKIVFIPAGVKDQFFNENRNSALNFKRIYGLESYILWIGVFQRNKNQIELIKALNSTNFPIVFIGAGIDSEYYQECIEISKINNIFIPQVPHYSELLFGALAGCAGFVELTDEPAGLSALEAGAAGKKMLLIKSEWSSEIFGDYIDLVESPFNHDEIKSWVTSISKDYLTSQKLSKYIRKNHHIDNIIKKLKEIL